MYYGLILLSVVLFGGCFALNDVYRKLRGSGLKISLEASFVGSLSGFLVLTMANGIRWECTPFTFVMAMLSSLVFGGFTFCSFRALEKVNLSLFSLFSMLGGMALPFLQGILFYGEKVTVSKILCFVLIALSLLLTVSRSEKKSGTAYCVGIFLLNGLSGVISKIFTAASFEKTSPAGYSIWIAVCSIFLSGGLWLFLFRNDTKTSPFCLRALCVGAVNGGINKIANLLLVTALSHVDASVQYPMVTGGVMIVSTLLCFLGERKPQKKEIFSVILAFIGMLVLFVIPI